MKFRFKSCLVGFFSLFMSLSVSANCIRDLGPYEDQYGFAIFPFLNTCDEAVTVNLCVKSFPAGRNRAVFNLYSGSGSGRNTIYITDGKWKDYYSYRWMENASVECPFY
ncbi:MAG: hypothetical protein EB078_01055 [Proteobacteria bacterium]|nr:hypothetical protein [Pseudomonadota bacterium]NDC23245.1 hypothetical protein [Pseudomonadota bacterium]NDD03467.1 hypothetical protein [Pseudomonadota bacterium]NDG25801.1 hypothetical protein [Pseudomonadota bacterium]